MKNISRTLMLSLGVAGLSLAYATVSDVRTPVEPTADRGAGKVDLSALTARTGGIVTPPVVNADCNHNRTIMKHDGSTPTASSLVTPVSPVAGGSAQSQS